MQNAEVVTAKRQYSKSAIVAAVITAIAIVYAFIVEPTDAVPVIGWLDECGIGAAALAFIKKATVAYNTYNLIMEKAVVAQADLSRTYQDVKNVGAAVSKLSSDISQKQDLATVQASFDEFTTAFNQVSTDAKKAKTSVTNTVSALPRKQQDDLVNIDTF